jgi:hypothetical protein
MTSEKVGNALTSKPLPSDPTDCTSSEAAGIEIVGNPLPACWVSQSDSSVGRVLCPLLVEEGLSFVVSVFSNVVCSAVLCFAS